jgi:mRNA interferase HigB
VDPISRRAQAVEYHASDDRSNLLTGLKIKASGEWRIDGAQDLPRLTFTDLNVTEVPGKGAARVSMSRCKQALKRLLLFFFSFVDSVGNLPTLRLVRIIKKSAIKAAWEKHPKAKSTLMHWMKIARTAQWKHLVEVRKSFPHADAVTVGTGKTATVFNITNDFRLITAIHYPPRNIIYILAFLTHSEYSQDHWKKVL